MNRISSVAVWPWRAIADRFKVEVFVSHSLFLLRPERAEDGHAVVVIKSFYCTIAFSGNRSRVLASCPCVEMNSSASQKNPSCYKITEGSAYSTSFPHVMTGPAAVPCRLRSGRGRTNAPLTQGHSTSHNAADSWCNLGLRCRSVLAQIYT